MKRALALVVIVGLWSLPLAAGEFLMNDSGETATALRVTFSQPVTITGFGDTLMDVSPPTESLEFTFSGGQVETWGSHWLNWEPESASLLSIEWLEELIALPEFNPEEAMTVPHSRQDQFQLALPQDAGGDVVGVITRTISVEQIPFVVTYEFESDSVGSEVEWTSTHSETSESPQILLGSSARFAYLSNRTDPEVRAKFQVDDKWYEWTDPDISFPLHNMTNIRLNAEQLFPDHSVVSAEWSARNGDPDDAGTFPIDSSSATTATLVSQWPNAIDVTCAVTTTSGTAEKTACALIYFRSLPPYRLRGSVMPADSPIRVETWERLLDGLIPEMLRMGMNYVLIPITWWYGFPDANGVFAIEPIYHDPSNEWSKADDPRGSTPTEEVLRYILGRFRDAGFTVFVGLDVSPYINQPEIHECCSDSGYGSMAGFMHSDGFAYASSSGLFNFYTHYTELLVEMDVAGISLGAEQGEMESFGGSYARTFFEDVVASLRAAGFAGAITYGANYIHRSDMCPHGCEEPVSPQNYSLADAGIPWDLLDLIGLTFYPTLASTMDDSTAEMYANAQQVLESDLLRLASTWGKQLYLLDCLTDEIDGSAILPVGSEIALENCSSTFAECIRDVYASYDPEEHRRWLAALLRGLATINVSLSDPLVDAITIDRFAQHPSWWTASEEDRMYQELAAVLNSQFAHPSHIDTIQVFFRDESVRESPGSTIQRSEVQRPPTASPTSSGQDAFQRELEQVIAGLDLGSGIAAVAGAVDFDQLPVVQVFSDLAELRFSTTDALSGNEESQTEPDPRFQDTGWRIGMIRALAADDALLLSIEFAPDDHPSLDDPVEYVLGIGSSLSVFVRPGRPVCAVGTVSNGEELEEILPFSFYSFDSDFIDIAIPRSVLAALGIDLEELVGKSACIRVTFMGGTRHSCVLYPCSGILERGQ